LFVRLRVTNDFVLRQKQRTRPAKRHISLT